jgi:hypothetical protein
VQAGKMGLQAIDAMDYGSINEFFCQSAPVQYIPQNTLITSSLLDKQENPILPAWPFICAVWQRLTAVFVLGTMVSLIPGPWRSQDIAALVRDPWDMLAD